MTNALPIACHALAFALCGALLGWVCREDTRSTADLWLKRTLLAFVLFAATGVCQALLNGGIGALIAPTLRLGALAAGVYCWCGYAASHMDDTLHEDLPGRWPAVLSLAALVMVLLNMAFGFVFAMGESGLIWRWGMGACGAALVMAALPGAVRAYGVARHEVTPSRITHLYWISAFPAALAAVLILMVIKRAAALSSFAAAFMLMNVYIADVRHQVSVDALTQVNNRQNLMGFLEYKLQNHTGEVYLVMVDVDDFKHINDTHGHLAGDRALLAVAKALKGACASMPRRPYIARYGGDEFIVVLEGTLAEAKELCSSVRHILKKEDLPPGEEEITISAGYAVWQQGMNAKALIARADEALYRAKPESLRR